MLIAAILLLLFYVAECLIYATFSLRQMGNRQDFFTVWLGTTIVAILFYLGPGQDFNEQK